jgi:hypothetical protein
MWFALALAAALGGAQPSVGQLTLDVIDHNGAAVPAVEIGLVGSVTREAKTDDEGRAVFRDLPAGSYRLSAGFHGFVSESREVAIRAGIATALRIEFHLEWSTDAGSGRPVRDTMRLHCSSSASRSVDDAWRAADTVAWVRIDRQTVYDHWRLREHAFPIVTVHDAHVVELFKAHPRLLRSTSAISVLQEAGTVERPDLIERASASGADLLDARREYVVFLRWSDRWQQWAIDGCDLGALEVDGDKVSPAGKTEISDALQGLSATELLATLRKMKN